MLNLQKADQFTLTLLHLHFAHSSQALSIAFCMHYVFQQVDGSFLESKHKYAGGGRRKVEDEDEPAPAINGVFVHFPPRSSATLDFCGYQHWLTWAVLGSDRQTSLWMQSNSQDNPLNRILLEKYNDRFPTLLFLNTISDSRYYYEDLGNSCPFLGTCRPICTVVLLILILLVSELIYLRT